MEQGLGARKGADVAGVVLAAGAGVRFGGPKQLARLWGRPLIEHALISMAAASLDRFAVVLGAYADPILERIELHGAGPVRCADFESGQSASLRAGIEACGDCDATLVTLGDQPLVSAEAIDRVVAARAPGTSALRATYDGSPGHPVLIESELFDAVAELEGDAGARDLIERSGAASVPCDGLGSPVDVDTPERLAELERSGPEGWRHLSIV